MAFPGTYNISYYKGDTFEFLLNPKDTSGNPFNLTGYDSSAIRFTISNYAGPEKYDGVGGAPTKISIPGYVTKVDNTYIKCAITPNNALEMTAGTTYVYDVEISKPGSDYDYVYTLLTGNITVKEQVSLPVPNAVPSASIAYTEFTNDGATSTATFTWSAPTGGPTITGYKLFVLPNPGSTPNFALAELKGTVGNTVFEYTFTGLTTATTYGIGIAAYNSAGIGTPGVTGIVAGYGA